MRPHALEFNNTKNLLKEEGNIRIEALYNIILTKKGQPDYLAIDIYTEARSWYKPKKTNIQGNVVYSSKLKGYGWQIGYEYLANRYKCTTELIRRKLVLLEKLGLLTRDFRTEYYHGKRFNNNMYLLVWKDTPHFYSAIGLEKKVSTTPPNQGDLCKNLSTPVQQKVDIIYVIPNNGKEKEEALAYSSFSSSTSTKRNTPLPCAREAEIVQITNAKLEPAPQEKIIEIPTLATGYPTEPAKVYQTEEIRVEASEVVTNCDELEAQPYGKSVQLESQALTEEKELYQFHKNRESSSGLNLLQDIPLLANLLSPCDERPTVDKLSTTDPEMTVGKTHVPIVDDSSIVELKTTEKHEEVMRMKERSPIEDNFENVLETVGQETKRNMEFELSGAIFKSFGGVKSDEIMENCKFIPINENKLGVQLSNGFSLTTTDRDRLKACIRLVYGEGINIVSSAVLKIALPKLEILVKPQIQQHCHQWTRFKNDLLNYLPEKTGHHSLNVWFDKFRVSEDMTSNRIILTGSRFYVDSVYNRFQSAIEYVTTKNKVTLELHFENNEEKPIIYKPNGGSR